MPTKLGIPKGHGTDSSQDIRVYSWVRCGQPMGPIQDFCLQMGKYYEGFQCKKSSTATKKWCSMQR
jgi:hypothetical protein